nr:lasso peptide biosynthesis B2 protein [Hyphomonas sp. 34-62-18]
MHASYCASQGVFFCPVDTAVVVFDARKNQYLYYNEKQSAWLFELAVTENLSDLTSSAAKFANSLANAGLISADDRGRNLLVSGVRPPPHSSLYDDIASEIPAPRLNTVPSLVVSLTTSWYALRRNKIDRALRHVGNWKNGLPSPTLSDHDNVFSLVRAFHALTPYFFTVKDACLYRSIALVKYLSLHRIPAACEIGVRLTPFKAHCWVEIDGIVLNDHLGKTAEYTKILSL